MKAKPIIALLTVASLLGFLVGACSLSRDDPTTLPTLETRGSGDITGITHFNNVETTDLTVLDDATITDALTVADITISDDLTVTDDAAIAGSATVGAAILDDVNTNLTGNATITPTISTHHVDSNGDHTLTLAACTVNGQLLILYGDDANDVSVADSHIRTTTGAALTLSQFDIALFVCMDTEWVEITLAANS